MRSLEGAHHCSSPRNLGRALPQAILSEGSQEYQVGKVQDKFKRVIKERSAYPEDNNWDLESLLPVTTYEIKDFFELVETNA